MYEDSLVDIYIKIYIYSDNPLTKKSFWFPEIIKKQGDEGVPDLVHVMRTLATESIPNLPPGGELASKWVLYGWFTKPAFDTNDLSWPVTSNDCHYYYAF